MKRASTKKVKAHPVSAASHQVLGYFTKLYPQSWQASTSTAIAGLAISIGASSFLAGISPSVAAEPGGKDLSDRMVPIPTEVAPSLPTYLVDKAGEPVPIAGNVNASLKANYQSKDRLAKLQSEESNISATITSSTETSALNNLREIQGSGEKYPTQQVDTQTLLAAIDSGAIKESTLAPIPSLISSSSANPIVPLRFTSSVGPLQLIAQTPSVANPLPPALQTLATAPMDVDLAMPLELLRGQQVSPELPPLGAGETYLPKALSPLKGYIWPAKGVLTSRFGWRWGRIHKGIDIAAPVGTPVFAAAPGVVVTAGWNSGGYGNLVDIRHADGSLTRYAHNNRILVQVGQMVEQGQEISEMGSTGHSTGPHCHFEVHPFNQGAVNPIAYLPH